VRYYWFPTEGHPQGRSTEPWFYSEGDKGWCAHGHPCGAPDVVSLRIIGGWVFPVLSLPEDGPRFRIVGTLVYLAGVDDPAWFELRAADGDREQLEHLEHLG
jgi:hypothetical protein